MLFPIEYLIKTNVVTIIRILESTLQSNEVIIYIYIYTHTYILYICVLYICIYIYICIYNAVFTWVLIKLSQSLVEESYSEPVLKISIEVKSPY